MASDGQTAVVAVSTTVVATTTDSAKLTPEERKSATELYGKALENFDKAIITVAGGALVLSLTFLHDVAPCPVADSATELKIGWLGLIFSLCFIVLSMLTGHKALEHYLEESGRTDYTVGTTILNVASAIALVVGLSGLVLFAQTNMFAPSHPCPNQSAPPAASK